MLPRNTTTGRAVQQSQPVPENVANVDDVVRVRKNKLHNLVFSLFFHQECVFFLFARTSNKVNITARPLRRYDPSQESTTMTDPDLRLASSMAFVFLVLTVAGPLAGVVTAAVLLWLAEHSA
jgi:hypothetical protein